MLFRSRGFSVPPMTAGIGLGRTDDAAGGDNFGSASGEVHRLRLRSERAEREARSWREEARTAKASRDKAAARHAEALAAARLAVQQAERRTDAELARLHEENRTLVTQLVSSQAGVDAVTARAEELRGAAAAWKDEAEREGARASQAQASAKAEAEELTRTFYEQQQQQQASPVQSQSGVAAPGPGPGPGPGREPGTADADTTRYDGSLTMASRGRGHATAAFAMLRALEAPYMRKRNESFRAW